MKYTIELTNKQKAQMDCIIDIVHRYVGFNPKLEPIKDWEDELGKQKQEAYDNGYNNGIEDLAHAMKVYFPLNAKERLDYFGTSIPVDRYAITNPKVLIDMAKAYEEKKKAEEIKVGDEIYFLDPNDKSIVTFVDKENRMATILTIRGKYASIRFSDAHKTGRHFDELEMMFNKLRGEKK